MLPISFNRLLTGTLSSVLKWQRASLCPCTQLGGEADQTCGVCNGSGRFYGAVSDPFRAGFIGQDSQSLRSIWQRMGGGEVGDAVLVIPQTAPCYDDIGERDRIFGVDATDTQEVVLNPALPPVALPIGYIPVKAYVRSTDKQSTVDVAFPTPDGNGRFQVSVTTVLRFRAPRIYEVVRELPHVRNFVYGLPKKVALKRVDMTER